MPKKIRIDHWCYEFKWSEHDSNYYDKHEDIDLMSCLSMDTEELNYEVRELKEDKKIEKLESYISCGWSGTCKDLFNDLKKIGNKINEIIDKLNEIERDKE